MSSPILQLIGLIFTILVTMISGLWAFFKLTAGRTINDVSDTKQLAKTEGVVETTLTSIKQNLGSLSDHVSRIEAKVDTFNDTAAQLKADRARIDVLEQGYRSNAGKIDLLQSTINGMQTDAISKLASMVQAVVETNAPRVRKRT